MDYTTAIGLAIVSLALAACASSSSSPGSAGTGAGRAAMAGSVQPATCGSTENLHVFGPVYLAGQPAQTDFALAKQQGIKTVINLRHPNEVPEFDEKKVVEGLGLAYINIPWKGEQELTDEVFDKGRAALSTAETPILLHCASANRVGAIWLAWRVVDGKVPYDQALAEARTIGLRTPGFETKARAYAAKHGA